LQWLIVLMVVIIKMPTVWDGHSSFRTCANARLWWNEDMYKRHFLMRLSAAQARDIAHILLYVSVSTLRARTSEIYASSFLLSLSSLFLQYFFLCFILPLSAYLFVIISCLFPFFCLSSLSFLCYLSSFFLYLFISFLRLFTKEGGRVSPSTYTAV